MMSLRLSVSLFLGLLLLSQATMPSLALTRRTPTPRIKGGPHPRIVGGTEVSPPYKYPFMAMVNPVLNDGTALLCGGTLVAPNWILTAAHCSVNAVASQSLVALHRHDISQDSMDVDPITAGVRKIIVNPNYNADEVNYDYAMWELDRSVTLAPITLDTGTYTTGETCTVIGWGDTSDGGTPSNVLMQVDIQVWDFNNCEFLYGASFDEDTQMCAGVAAGGKDSCQGDSGGPLFIVDTNGTYVQIGVVSFGDGCGMANSPGVYSRVAGQRDWIEYVIATGAGSLVTPSLVTLFAALIFLYWRSF